MRSQRRHVRRLASISIATVLAVAATSATVLPAAADGPVTPDQLSPLPSTAAPLTAPLASTADFANPPSESRDLNLVPSLLESPEVPPILPTTGFDPATSVLASRTAESDLYDNTDGSHTALVYGGVRNALTPSGTYAPIDTTLTADATGYHPGNDLFGSHFASRADSASLVSVKAGSGTLAFSMIGAASVAPTVGASRLTYAGVQPGVDLQYRLGSTELKELIVLQHVVPAPTWTFGLTTNGVTPQERTDGSIGIYDNQSGAEVLRIPAGSAWDSNVDPSSGDSPHGAVALHLTSVGGAWRVTVAPDVSWLTSPSRVWPVYVDPTLSTVNVGTADDAYVREGTSGTTYNGSSQYNSTVDAYVDQFGCYSDSALSFLHYSMSTVTGKDVVRATWKGNLVWSYYTNTAQSFWLHPVRYGWSASSVTWDTFPSYWNLTNSSGTPYVFTDSGYRGQAVSIDVTPIAQSWLAGKITNNGIVLDGGVLQSGSDSCPARYFKIASDENTDGSAPYIQVDYNNPPAAPSLTSPANGTTTHDLTPTLSASGTDPNGDPLKYYFQICLDSSATQCVADSGSTYLTASSWTVPAGKLDWNRTYYWRARTYDGRLASSYSAVRSLTPGDTPPPAPGQANASPVDNAVITSLRPTLSVSPVTDPNGDAVRYWFTVAAGGDGVSGSVVNSGWISSNTWTIPTGVLQDGVHYTWQVSSAGVDGAGATLLSSSSAFTNHFRVDTRVGTSSPSPHDLFGPVSVNLFNGNATVALSSPGFATVGGPIGLSYTYNSQAPSRSGLRGWYYNTAAPAFPLPAQSDLELSRTDPQLDFTWPAKGPFPPALHGTYFQAHWQGLVTAPTTGTYLFGGIHDDGLKITVNGVSAYTHTGYAPAVDYTGATGVSLTAGVPVSLSVDYFNKSGPAQLHVYVKTSDGTTVKSQPLPASWLSTQPNPLPNGWVLSTSASAGVGVLAATVTDSSVVLTTASGSNVTYRWTGSGYAPPAGADGILTRNDDGSLTMLTGSGVTYDFDKNGTLQRVTSGSDDRRPAAARFTWTGTTGNAVPQLSTIEDPVTNHKITLRYSGDAACSTAPSGFDSSAPPGMLCAATYDWNNTRTEYYYVQKQLARIVDPGGLTQDFGYTNGLLTGVRSPLAADWVAVDPTNRDTAAIRPLTMTTIAYEPTGTPPRVASVTQPAPDPLAANAASTQPSHGYSYVAATQAAAGSANVTAAGLTPASGYVRRVTFNVSGQSLADYDAYDHRTALSTWDSHDNLLATLDAAGRMSTSKYDDADRRTDTWGPAPSSCFDTTTTSATYLRPLASGCPSPNQSFVIPHGHTDYDGGLTGLAGTWWSAPKPSGSPAAHATNGLGDITAATVIPGGTAGAAFSGTLTGDITVPSDGVYGFGLTPGTDTNVRVSVDDRVVVDRFSTHAEAVRADNPAAYWRLNEASGASAADASGNGAAATYVGTVLRSQTGAPQYDSDTAVGLDGISSYVRMPSDTIRHGATAPLTITGWFKVATGQRGPIIGYQTGAVGTSVTSYTPMIYVGTDGKLYSQAAPATRLVSASAVTDNQWHQVALILEPTGGTTSPIPVKQTVCLDDRCVSNVGTVDFKTMSDNQIGAAYTSTSYPATPSSAGWWYYNGQLDDFAVYRTALSPGRVHAQYAAARPLWSGSTTGYRGYTQEVLEDDPLAYWPLDDASGATTVADLSGRNATGAVASGITLGANGATANTATAATTAGSQTAAITGSHTRAVNDFSFESWVNFTGTPTIRIDAENTASILGTTGERYAFSPDNLGNDAGAGLSVGSNGVSVYEHGSAYMPPVLVWQPATGQRPITGWHHLAVVYTDRTPTLYVDGVPVRTGKKSPKTHVYSPITIGAHQYGGFQGAMDEAAFYGDSLPAERILSHYLAGRAVLEDGRGVLTAGHHRIRVDVKQPSGTAHLGLTWTLPGTSTAVAVPASALTPRYGLATRNVFDDNDRAGFTGRVKTTTYSDATHGIDPALGLPVDTTADPDGLALVTHNAYETPGTGFLRSTGKTMPAGNGWTTTYYGDNELRDDPCGTFTGANQAGMSKLSTGPDPDGAGPATARVEETVRDSVGRAVATRVSGGAWTCVRYDARGRSVRADVPARGAQPANVVTSDYAVGGNPLVTSVTDTAGTVTTRTDLLGRTVSYTDVWGLTTLTTYDLAGRLTQTSGPAGLRESTYDDAGRVTSVKYQGAVMAVPSYDATTGELTSVSYPSGAGNGGNGTSLASTTRDPAGRAVGVTWSLASSVTVTDAVTRSQSGRIVDESVDGVDDDPAGPNYAYDAAGRLTRAVVAGHTYTYGFAATGGCGSLTTAGKNTHRTSATDTTSSGSTTTSYCWDAADRLTSTTGALAVTPTYDADGNVTRLSDAAAPADAQNLVWDGGGRHVSTTVTGTNAASATYKRDATGRIVERTSTGGAGTTVRYGHIGDGDSPALVLDTAGTVLSRVLALPGGVVVSLPTGAQPAGSPATTTWSYPNVHGDVLALADASGVKQGTTRRYDPSGKPLSTLPDNMPGTADYGWEGSNQRLHEHVGTLSTIEMGARPYQPQLGIFLSVDPVVGGSANDYDYGNADPVNNHDTAGTMVGSDGGSGGFMGPVAPIVEPTSCTPTFSPGALVGVAASTGSLALDLADMADAPGVQSKALDNFLTKNARNPFNGRASALAADGKDLANAAREGSLVKWAGSTRVTNTLAVVGVALTATSHIAAGDSVATTVGGTAGSVVGGYLGVAAGTAACGAVTTASAGFGAIACPFMIGGMSALGGFLGDKAGSWLGGLF